MDLAGRMGATPKCIAGDLHLVGFLVGCSHLAGLYTALSGASSAEFRFCCFDFGDRNSSDKILPLPVRTRLDYMDDELVCE